MRNFARLIEELDGTNKTNEKVNLLARYFREAEDRDKVWTIAVLSHRRPPRPVNHTQMRLWATELAGLSEWLFEESYHIVGDLAETIALIVSDDSNTELPPLHEFMRDMIRLRKEDEETRRSYLFRHWKQMDFYCCFVFNKLITGGFRIGVSQKLMTRALARATGLDEDVLAYRLTGSWDPSSVDFQDFFIEGRAGDENSKPYPFYLAHALEDEPASLGPTENWAIEHKWDGIRAQVIVRGQEVFVWSRGEELVTDSFPEFDALAEGLPDGTVLDGEILPYPGGYLGNFKDLQTRLGRKTVSARVLTKMPVELKAYDLLEFRGQDLREQSYSNRRDQLEKLLTTELMAELPLSLSERMTLNSWDEVARERARSREIGSEGLMIKRLDSPYRVGRKKGDWWKWKVDPLTIDAVLTYAMRGHGRRSTLFTDYTFALWQDNEEGEPELTTFAKAYSGLTDAEFRELDNWIKRNTVERFGPVRSVTPEHVFEIAFEGIAFSKRHKSGVATRFPRIVRWRKDKKIEDANHLNDVIALIRSTRSSESE